MRHASHPRRPRKVMPLAASAIARHEHGFIRLFVDRATERAFRLLVGRTHSAEKVTLAIAAPPLAIHLVLSGDKSEAGREISRPPNRT